MYNIRRLSELPHVFYLSGDDVTRLKENGNIGFKRNNVKKILFSDNNGIGNFRGKVDFIICYVIGGDGPPDYDGADHSPVRENPANRPLRGIIKIPKGLRWSMSNSELGGHLAGTIGHEIGHYWLVPGRARIRIGNEEVDTPTTSDIIRTINHGGKIPKVPIIGRGDSHWSPFIHSEGSFMDGIDHSFGIINKFSERNLGYSVSTGVMGSGVSFDFDNEEITTGGKYSDLELYLMGLNPLDRTPADRTFQILEPNWVFPLSFHAGLYIETDDDRIWYHGFYKRPDHIQAETIKGESEYEPVSIIESLFPLSRVALRVVQINRRAQLQVKIASPRLNVSLERENLLIDSIIGHKFRTYCLPPEFTKCDILSEPKFHEPGNNPYQDWRSIAKIRGKIKLIGIAARHIGPKCFVQLAPKRLFLYENNHTTEITQDKLTLKNEIHFEDQSWGKTIQDDGSIIIPYSVGKNISFNGLHHTLHEDKAPRLVMAAPNHDFVFGGELQLKRCININWAGGSGSGKNYVGNRRKIAFEDYNYLVNWGSEYETIRQADPHGGAYRFLFCLVGLNDLEEVNLRARLTNLDHIRRAWIPCFEALTRGRRGAITDIPFPV